MKFLEFQEKRMGEAENPSVDILTTFICSTLYLSLPKFLF